MLYLFNSWHIYKAKESSKDKKEEKKDKKDKKEGEAQKKELPGGLIVKDVKEGTGRAAKKGDTVSMRYIGKFTDGKVFDSNTKGKPVCDLCSCVYWRLT